MSKRHPDRGKNERNTLRLSRVEKLVVIGRALALFILLYLITPRNAQRAVEHARGHAAHQPSDTAGARREPQKSHRH